MFLLSFPWHPALRSPNELSRLMQTRALVDFGELSLNRAMRVYGPVGDLSVREGRYYPSKAPLMSFAAVPVYAVLRAMAGGHPGAVPEIPLVFFARLLLTALPTLLSLVLVERFLIRYVSPALAAAVCCFYALGTLAFSYSLLFMSHQTTATLLLAGFYLCWQVVRRERAHPWLIAAGLLLGLSVAAEYTSAMPAGLIAAYATFAGNKSHAERLRAAGGLALGALPAVVFLAWYHEACFGGALETGYRHLADAAYQPWHEGGFLGIRTPTWTAFAGSFFSPLRGLFMLSPLLVLGFTGLRRLWNARNDHPELGAIALFTLTLALGYVYFTSSFSYVSWGWTTGPRHLTGLVPFLLLPVALEIEATRTQLGRGAVTGLAASSILVTAALTFINYIPDDVSEGVFGLFVPLAHYGFVVPSFFSFVGIKAPIAGWIPIFLAVIAVIAMSSHLLGRLTLRSLTALSLVIAAFLGVHRVAYKNSEHDQAARTLLERVWLTPPGSTSSFWTTDGRSRS